jgi:peptide/nickel transport system substrate-binding protein
MRLFFAAVSVLAIAACAGPPDQQGSGQQGGGQRQPTTLRLSSRFEVQTLAFKYPDAAQGGASAQAKRAMNAGFALIDGKAQGQPELAEHLPQLNTESWQVFPDGRMTTTYRLRSGLTWHDGNPLTADDFVFAWRLYKTPALGFTSIPQDQMEMVEAADPRTVVITWKSPLYEAGILNSEQFPPLPAHLLNDSLQSVLQDPTAADAFINSPFWAFSYVGAGPYRLERREPGQFIEGSAFDGYALGRPKIDRIRIRFIGDENSVLTNLLAGELDFSPRLQLRFEHAKVLAQDWVPSGKGKYIIGPDYFIKVQHQFRPEYQTEPAILDARVRRAMAYSIDRQGLVDGIFEGQSELADTWMYRATPYFAEADRAITKYPFDPRRTEQLMLEAGMVRDGQGSWAYPSGKRFQPDFIVRAGTQHERGQAILVDTWRRAGLDVQPSVLPDIAVPREERYTWPNMQAQTSDAGDYNGWASSQIGTPGNRWTGSNRAGWSNPEFDRLYEAFNRTLDDPGRNQLHVQMLKLLSEELPGYVVYESPALLAHSSALRNVEFDFPGPPRSTEMFNLHEWEIVK